MQSKKAGARGEKILGGIRSLIKLARLANYEIVWVPGHNGGCLFWANRIEIGLELPNTEKLIVLSHEIGHVFDYTENFPKLEEMVTIMEFWNNYSHGEMYFQREKRAWDFGKYLLEYVGVWTTVKNRYAQHRRSSLKAYRRRLETAQRAGTHTPDKASYAVALKKVQKELKLNGLTKTIKSS